MNKTHTTPRPVLKADHLYLGDNGRCFCGDHAGMTAKYSGRDLSGQRVQHLTPSLIAGAGFDVDSFACEDCGRTPKEN